MAGKLGRRSIKPSRGVLFGGKIPPPGITKHRRWRKTKSKASISKAFR